MKDSSYMPRERYSMTLYFLKIKYKRQMDEVK